jgi:hypothetical protein
MELVLGARRLAAVRQGLEIRFIQRRAEATPQEEDADVVRSHIGQALTDIDLRRLVHQFGIVGVVPPIALDPHTFRLPVVVVELSAHRKGGVAFHLHIARRSNENPDRGCLLGFHAFLTLCVHRCVWCYACYRHSTR